MQPVAAACGHDLPGFERQPVIEQCAGEPNEGQQRIIEWVATMTGIDRDISDCQLQWQIVDCKLAPADARRTHDQPLIDDQIGQALKRGHGIRIHEAADDNLDSGMCRSNCLNDRGAPSVRIRGQRADRARHAKGDLRFDPELARTGTRRVGHREPGGRREQCARGNGGENTGVGIEHRRLPGTHIKPQRCKLRPLDRIGFGFILRDQCGWQCAQTHAAAPCFE